MKRMIHYSGVHEMIQNPASDAIEWDEKILEGVESHPKSATVVTEEKVDQRNRFYGRVR